MYQFKVVRHSDITPNELDGIIKVKSVAWPYSYEEQVKWVKNNLSDSDMHAFLVSNEEKLVAYLNLVERQLQLNGDLKSVLGIGNVCSVEYGRGYGSKLMEKTSDFLDKHNFVGLLFCKQEMVGFYKKYGWKKREILIEDRPNIISMTYNLVLLDNVEIKYKCRLF